MPDANSLPDLLDSVLRKYGKIWIWSILSAAVAALSMRALANLSAIQYGVFAQTRERDAAFFFISLTGIAPSICTLASVWYLLLFLRHHIVLVLFPASSSPEAANGENVAPAAPPDGGRLLCLAFGAMVIAIALEIAVTLSSFIYRAAA